MAEAPVGKRRRADLRRDALLDRIADHFLAEGLAETSLRPLAKAVGTSDRMLLYYFTDKAEIIGATLDRISARLVAELASIGSAGPVSPDALRIALIERLFAQEFWPFLRLFLQIAAHAAQGDPVYRTVGERIGRGFLAWGASQIDLPDAEARERAAATIMIEVEGRLFLQSIGMTDVIAKVR